MNDDIELPPLPPAEWLGYDPERGDLHGHSFDDLREFAHAAVIADRARRVSAEPVGEIVGTEKRGFDLMTLVRWEPGFCRTAVGTKLYAAPPPTPPSAEPVAWISHKQNRISYTKEPPVLAGEWEPLYLAPPPTPLAEITDEIVERALRQHFGGSDWHADFWQQMRDTLRAALEGK